jgi:hypothetical protein
MRMGNGAFYPKIIFQSKHKKKKILLLFQRKKKTLEMSCLQMFAHTVQNGSRKVTLREILSKRIQRSVLYMRQSRSKPR